MIHHDTSLAATRVSFCRCYSGAGNTRWGPHETPTSCIDPCYLRLIPSLWCVAFSLHRNLAPHTHWLSNSDYDASDHQLLGCTITFDEPQSHDSESAADTTATVAAARASTRGRVSPSRCSSASSASHSHASASGRHFRSKSHSTLRQLMPLQRPRPGIITSSSRQPHVYVSQIVAFWIVLAAMVWIAYESIR
jgi:hypothetical protein